MFANKLGDLNDFLAPSLECIKPLPKSGTMDLTADLSLTASDVKLRPDLIKSKAGSKIAQVTLQDCLACSGCVTSAEAILIQQHSVEEFLNLFTDSNEIAVAISP
jgi:hypothetical protein